MKLLLDEMHAPAAAAQLIDQGWDVTAVAGSANLRGMPDEDLLAVAARQRRAIVTENIANFSILNNHWTAEGQDHSGIIFTSPSRFHRASLAYPGNLITALDTLLTDFRDQGSSWIWWL